MIKRLIGAAAALVIAITSIGTMKATAKVIQPEVVKTEKWTTSYWIDDDKDTLYPYIDCEADIYNDGSVKIYAWNIHEFDGFATVTSHTITLVDLEPVRYSAYKNSSIYATDYPYEENALYKENEILPYKISYFADEYSCSDYSNSLKNNNNYTKYHLQQPKIGIIALKGWQYQGALPNFKFSDRREGNPILYLRPTVEPTGTYNFRILGHEFTITSDLLQTTQIPEPPVADDTAQYEKEIKDLKAQIAALKAERESYLEMINTYETLLTSVSLERGDVNYDGFINAVDASQILAYYAYTSTGGHLDFMDFLEGKADKEES